MMQGQSGAMPYPGPQGMPGMDGMPGPGMGGMPGPGMAPGGYPGMPMIDPASCGPDGMPGVGLPMGATYYPGISGDGCGGLFGWCKGLLYCDSGDRRAVYGKVGYIGLWRESLPRPNLLATSPPPAVDLTV